MTVADADRDRVIAVLREQAGEGRLDLDEFGQRLDEAYQAKTLDELRHALRELPVTVPLGEQVPSASSPQQRPQQQRTRSRSAPVSPQAPSNPRSPARSAPRPFEQRHREFNKPERVVDRHVAAKAAWGAHLGAYLAVNLMLVVIWFLTSPGGYFWPMWPMMGWGIGLASHGMAHAAGSKARRHKLGP